MADTKTFHSKLLEVQQEIQAIKRTEQNPFFKSRYFDINALLDEVKPILNKHELFLYQPLSTVDEGKRPALRTVITDGKDEIISCVLLPDIQDPQKMGSCITYYRRYALQSLLALQAKDDDANDASEQVVQEVANEFNAKKTFTKELEASQPKVCTVCGKEHYGKFPKCIECWKKEQNS